MPFDQWPLEDKAAWDAATSRGGLLLDCGSAADLRPATLKRYIQAYGHWLHFLYLTNGLDPDPGMAKRVTPTTIRAFLKSLEDRNLPTRTQATYLQSVHNALYHMVRVHDWSWLRSTVNRLFNHVATQPRPYSQLPEIDVVYRRALSAMRVADKGEHPRPLWDSVHYRDALLVAIAAATVLRRRNLALLDLKRHLRRLPEGWRITIPRDEVKNRVRIEASLPESLVAPLDRYVEYHRPRLLQHKDHHSLFVRYTGEPYTVNSISCRIRKVTRRLGFEMSCHDFRRSAASTLATARPDLAMIIGHFLGHKGQRTSEKFYNRAQMVASSRRYTSLVIELRNGQQSRTRNKPNEGMPE